VTRYAFDIETNGLLPEVDTLHSLVLKDLDTGEVWSCSSFGRTLAHGTTVTTTLKGGLSLLEQATYVTGHNIVGYDLPVLKHLYPWFKLRDDCVVRDTFILAKMIWPVDSLKEKDFPRWRASQIRVLKGLPATFPGQLIGAQKLEAWGYRMGRMKGEYSGDVKAFSKEFTAHGDIKRVPEWARCLVSVDSKGKPILDPWKAWNQPMQDYCVQDVEVTHELWKLIESHLDGTGTAAKGIGWSPESVELEHRVAVHMIDQEARGYGFDRDGAIGWAAKLKTRQRELEDALVVIFGHWWQPTDDKDKGHTPVRAYQEKLTQFPDITKRRISDKTGKELAPYVGPPVCDYAPDAPFVRITWTKFNPKSRQHLGDRLQEVFGWVPLEFGGKDGDQAKVDETTITGIPESILPANIKDTIMEFLVVSKTLGALADGKKCWIDLCKEDGRIHGRMDPLGTVSHRGSHFDPNLGQVSAVTKEKSPTGRIVNGEPEVAELPVLGWKGGFGVESRTLFRPGRRGWWQTGVDASGLELRLLGHYLHPFDGGAFASRVSTPGLDIHAENAKITGLSRGDTKTVTYAFLYGAGALKIGMGVGVKPEEVQELAHSASAKGYLGWLQRRDKGKFVRPDDETLAYWVRGNSVSKAFLEGITGLKDLKKDLVAQAEAQGFIVAIDGRKLHVKSPHVTINQALQGGGAVACKMWMLELDLLLQGHYALTRDVDYGQMAWVHDELQFEHREEAHGQIIIEASSRAMRTVSEKLSFNGLLDTDGRTGRNWKDCH
jgi:DNA polymerase-1